MALPLPLMRRLQEADPMDAWQSVFDYAWTTFSPALQGSVKKAINKRERLLKSVDLYLATAAWDLWESYEGHVARTADALESWWTQDQDGKAVLILDGLSLREVPWLLQGAAERGYEVHQQRPTGAELPADTTPFANAMGLSGRSSLQNNGAPSDWRLAGARTETVDLPWADCAKAITSHPRWVLWHHWPDKRVHQLDGHGAGLAKLIPEAQAKLLSDDFWALIERLTTGRRLVITADHGYAAGGLFPDTSNRDQAQHLKDHFGAKRWVKYDDEPSGGWVPPIDLVFDSAYGSNRYVVGQRKWRAQGGYPTLTHGGLSVLEVVVPFIEISRPAEA